MLYVPPLIVSFLFIFTNSMYLRHEIVSIGIISQPAALYSLFTIQTIFHTLWGIILMFSYAKTAPQNIERKQAFMIGLGSLIPVIIGVTADQILPLVLGFRPTVPTVVFDVALMNFFIYLAMRRYSLFAISPALAADTIIETMPDSLLVTDLEGRIIFLNEEATKFFRIPKEEIIGKPIQSLFKNPEKYQKLYQEVVNKKIVVERFEAELIDPLGEQIPSLINASFLREKIIGESLGVVFVIRDIRG